jgi:uncharacterized protein
LIIRDPIHSDIYLDPIETAILDSKEMQNLRGIKQLGNAYLVYPTAVHTRFDHSIGVNSVFKRICFELGHKEGAARVLKNSDLLPIKIAALLHDVTHLPFGHTFEDNMDFWERHDEKRRYIDLFHSGSGEIGKILVKEKIEDTVLNLLTVKNPEKNLDDPWQAQILTAPICADLLDYLRRDAYFCGLKRNYDDRIFKYFDLQKNDDDKYILVLDLTKNNNLRIDALSETLNILRLRCYLTQAVYYHHTKLCADAIVSKALHIAIAEKKITKENLNQTGDEKFLDTLLQIKDPQISNLITRIKERKLLKRAFTVTANTLTGTKKERFQIKNKFVTKYQYNVCEKSKMEREIADEAELSEEDIIIHCIGDESLKESSVCVRLQSPEGITELNSSSLTNEETKRIEQEYLDLWGLTVFSPENQTSRVHEICKNVFDMEGETLSKSTDDKKQMNLDGWE